MQTRTALGAAILCGLAAVLLVAADVAWSLEARIDAQTSQGWQTVDARPDPMTHERSPFGMECAGMALRLVVTNDKPFADTVEIRVSTFNATSKRTDALFEDTWRLDRFEERIHTFTVPEAALPPEDPDERDPTIRSTHVDVRVGDLWLGTCVQKEA